MYVRNFLARISLVGLLLLCLSAGTARADNTRILMQTELGDVELELFDDTTPITVANFRAYVNADAYDNLVIHRSISNFVIQAGALILNDPLFFTITPGAPIQNEVQHSNVRGTIAMALSGNPADPNSGTSQWFINVADNTGLDGAFTVFGQVTSGLSVVDAINALPTQVLSLPIGVTPDVPLENWMTGDPVFASNLVLVNDTLIMPEIPIAPWPAALFGSVGLIGLALGLRRRHST